MKIIRAALPVLFLIFSIASNVRADVFSYVDGEGNAHFVDSMEKVPEQYRGTVKGDDSLPPLSKVKPDRKQLYEKENYPLVSKSTEQVEIFVAEWCPYCRTLEDFLKKEGIRYTRRDIENDPKAKKEFSSLGGGGIPLTRIGKKLIRGYKPQEIARLAGAKK